MKKNFRVIQINGFRGLCMALAIVTCLIAGFVVFPGLLVMLAWNFVSEKIALVPTLGLLQGTLLWGIMVVSYMIVKKRSVMVSFKAPTELNDDELKEVMDRIKMETTAQMMNDIITNARAEKKSSVVDIKQNEVEENKEVELSNKNIDN